MVLFYSRLNDMQEIIPRNPNNMASNDIASINAKMTFHVNVKSVAKNTKEPTILIAADIKINGEYLLKLQQVGLKRTS